MLNDKTFQKTKLQLEEISVSSFVTSLSHEENLDVRGGGNPGTWSSTLRDGNCTTPLASEPGLGCDTP